MGNVENKALLGRYIELWNSGEMTIADEIFTPDYVDHLHPDREPGPAAVKQEVSAFRAAFPDAKCMVEGLITQGDLVAFRFRLSGTHLGQFGPFLPTGQTVTLTGIGLCPVAGRANSRTMEPPEYFELGFTTWCNCHLAAPLAFIRLELA